MAESEEKDTKQKKKRKSARSTAPTQDLEFRKANASIGLRVLEGQMTMLSRKLYNSMVLHAQRLRVPGLNAPLDTAAARKFFWAPLSDIAGKAAYDSNDTKLLKAHLVELQNIRVRLESDKQWTSENLVSSVTLYNPHGLNKQGGVVWLGWAFPPETHELVTNPGADNASYTRLSVYYQGVLSTGPALALYEVCRRYATNPSKKTSADSYAHWHEVLTGTPIVGDLIEYKYFKRNILKPAIENINKETDIEIKLIEHKTGRRITRLQFEVELKKQIVLELVPAAIDTDDDLLAQLVAFGFSQVQAADLISRHPHEKLRNAIQVINRRLSQTHLGTVDSKEAYFLGLLRKKEGIAAPGTQKDDVSPPETKEKAVNTPYPHSMREKFSSHRREKALEQYRSLDVESQEELLVEFKTENTSPVSLTRELKTRLSQTAFGTWYAGYLWGEPTDEAIGEFAKLPA